MPRSKDDDWMDEAGRARAAQTAPGETVDRLPLERYRIDYTVPDDNLAFKVVFRIVQSCLGAGWAAKVTKQSHEERLLGEDIWSSHLRHVGVEVEVQGFDLSRLPKVGPAVFVANHPTGVMDGHLIGSVIEKNIRSDFKFLAVPRFCDLPGMKDRLIPVYLPSPSGRPYPDAERLIAEAREQARRHVEGGGAMVIFPSGPETLRTPSGVIQDGPWRHGAFALAEQTGAKVVPVHIEAPLAPIRVWMLRLHPVLFHAAAPHDAMNLRGKTVTVTFGDPDSDELKEALSDLSTAPDKVRELVYRLPEMA